MTTEQNQFIEDVYTYLKKYAPTYNIQCYSVPIAQAIKESAWGTSDKVYDKDLNGNILEERHNYFGLKWRDGRCEVSNDYFEEWTAEQHTNGDYENIVSKFCKFKSLEECVLGYLQWLNIPSYAVLKGVTSPEDYAQKIKDCHYASSLTYVSSLINGYVDKYDLRKYDPIVTGKEEVEKMVINVHAGHNPDGMIACGAIGLIKESTEARLVKDEVIRQLQLLGHTVYDCTVNDGTSKSNVLQKIVAKCNSNKVDLDVSIHFNSATSTSAKGTETYVYSTTSKAYEYAQNVNNAIVDLGFTNRGVKTSTSLYVLKNTSAPAMLVECCFVKNADDVARYKYKEIASAIVKGITGEIAKDIVTEDDDTIVETETNNDSTTVQELYRVQVGAYSIKENAENMLVKLKQAGFDGFITN